MIFTFKDKNIFGIVSLNKIQEIKNSLYLSAPNTILSLNFSYFY